MHDLHFKKENNNSPIIDLEMYIFNHNWILYNLNSVKLIFLTLILLSNNATTWNFFNTVSSNSQTYLSVFFIIGIIIWFYH